MRLPLTGGCQCGGVRYEIKAAAKLSLYVCHCTECQRQSGSAFSLLFARGSARRLAVVRARHAGYAAASRAAVIALLLRRLRHPPVP